MTAVLSCLATAACDDTFVPIAPGAAPFSVHGYLDASADTQWIRVMPIRKVAVTTREPLSATVDLQDLTTGRVIPLRDSITRFSPPGPDVGSEGIFVHNFWTLERIEPGGTYGFALTVDGEVISDATVEIPQTYTVETWMIQGGRNNLLVVEGVPHVVSAGFYSYFTDTCGEGILYRPVPVPASSSNRHEISIGRHIPPPSRPGCEGATRIKDEIVIYGSAVPWPPGTGSVVGLGTVEQQSNVSNSIGFLGGVVTYRLPYESCTLLGFDPPQYCILRYDVDFASVSGRVRDGSCGRQPLADALVELREISEARNPKVRSALTYPSGSFSIGALEPGTYAITVTRGSEYIPHTDTIQIVKDQAHPYDVLLTRPSCDS